MNRSLRRVAGTVSRPVAFLLSCAAVLSSITACSHDDAPPAADGGAADGGASDAGGGDAASDAGQVDAFACPDVDGDGHGEASCDDDCDDTDATRYPGATEICDADDEDCNDATLGRDGDADGFESDTCCNGTGTCGADCDDALNTVNPGAAEVCDGLDDNCNGTIDEAVCVDECALGAPCGDLIGLCTDTFTGYTCACSAGYSAPPVGGPCREVDECASGTDDCSVAHGICANTAGNFGCSCEPGWTGTGRGAGGCVDVDECATAPVCGAGIGSCANAPGGYACTCVAGYEAPLSGGSCVEINECTRGTDDCDPADGICTNAPGSFTCACPPGVGGTGRGAGGCSGPRFTDLGDGTVRDNGPRALVWQQAFSPTPLTQADSVAYCAGLMFDGGGWRLPTVDELFSIVDARFTPTTIDLLFFPGTGLNWFWTSSPDVFTSSRGWYVGFNFGGTFTTGITERYHARCVR